MSSTGQTLRVEVFLDGSNLYRGLKQQYGDGRYDLQKLVRHVVRGRKLTSVNFYTGTPCPRREHDKEVKQRQFLHRIRQLPIPMRVFTRPLKYPNDWPSSPPEEKGVDAKIVQDLIMGAVDNRYDVAVILTGDRDFEHVVRLIHDRFGKTLETSFPNTRRHLYDACRTFFSAGEVITRRVHRAISLG